MKKKSENLTHSEILRVKAEELLGKYDTKLHPPSEPDILKINHELAVHQIELEMQNQELIEAKENLEIVLEKYKDLYDFAPAGYITLTREGEIVEINFHTAKILGKDRRSLIKNSFRLYISDESRLIFDHFLNQIFIDRSQQFCEIVIPSSDDSQIIASLSGFPNKNNKYADINLIDISDRRLLNEFTLANKELQQLLQLNADKDLFISVMAHDLRNHFGVLLAYSELLSENTSTLKSNETRKYVDEVYKSSHDIYNLLEDLLKWSRVRSRIPFDLQKLNFNKICKDVTEILRASAVKKNIKISCSTSEDIVFMADSDMIKAVFRNLISNAIKFTGRDGTIILSINKTDGNIIFSVSDNGIGIEPSRIPNLFDITQFSATPGTGNETGTGLGLLLCKEFIEKHGGKIWVESQLGKGSAFYFSIPYHLEKIIKINVSDDDGTLWKLKILIADDDAGLRLVLSNLMKEYCREILFAENGTEAVEIYRNNTDIDLILMDHHMPQMNGYEAANHIRTISRNVIIIVETADNYSELIERTPRDSINDFFFKPYNKAFLNKLMKKYFSHTS